jgi:uncharacterized damage-inducible protein DinB
MADEHAEPWLRGTLQDVPLPAMPLIYSFQMVREDIRRFAGDLTVEQLWRKLGNNAPVGFHMRHIGGSIDRLLTYLEERELTAAQLGSMQHEAGEGASFTELFDELDSRLNDAERRLKALPFSDLGATRYVGRKRLEVTVLGLLVHIAEHTQRHLGQAITTAKLVRSGSYASELR